MLRKINVIYLLIISTTLLLTSNNVYSKEQACASSNGANSLTAAESADASDLAEGSADFWQDIARSVQQRYGSNVNHRNATGIGPSLVINACATVLGVRGCSAHHFPDIPFNGSVSIEQSILNWAGVQEDSSEPAATCDPALNDKPKAPSNGGGDIGNGGSTYLPLPYMGGSGVIYQRPRYGSIIDCRKTPESCQKPPEDEK